MSLSPLRFEPIFQYRLWGGRRLEKWSRNPIAVEGPVGEAWILSDRDDFASVVSEGPFAGQTLRTLLATHGQEMLGKAAGQYDKFPLLLKFLDATEMLSVQVHPSDEMKDLLPAGERGKTESWLVMEAEEGSSIYAGLQPGVTPEGMRKKSAAGTVEEDLASFQPHVGDGLFIEAGTVHALGGGVVVFETQQNSDVTFRLFDWNRVDEKTGKPREMHVEKAIQSTNFAAGAVEAIKPKVLSTSPAKHEGLFNCEFFTVDRWSGEAPFQVGADNEMRVIVAIEGSGNIFDGNVEYVLRPGDVYVLPASVGSVEIRPAGSVIVAEVSVPLKA